MKIEFTMTKEECNAARVLMQAFGQYNDDHEVVKDQHRVIDISPSFIVEWCHKVADNESIRDYVKGALLFIHSIPGAIKAIASIQKELQESYHARVEGDVVTLEKAAGKKAA